MKQFFIFLVLILSANGLYSNDVYADVNANADKAHYAAGSIISSDVSVYDNQKNALGLRRLIDQQDKKLTALFIFGGGGMGHEKTQETGGLWCPDSFADMEILHGLRSRYQERLGIVAVAVPPVFHTRRMGFEHRVLLDRKKGNAEYQAAQTAFINSTEASYKNGTIPVQPVYDADFNLLVSAKEQDRRGKVHPVEYWHGAFRAANETQSYGVPNLWLIDEEGRVAAKPFRGNVYHGHAHELNISYTLDDVSAIIDELLSNQ